EKEEEPFEDIHVKIQQSITEELLATPASFVVEQLGDNYHEAPILGFSIVNENGVFFIPKETALGSDRFKEWAEDESKKKWVFDAKRAAVALRWQGIELSGAEFDVLLAAYIINPGHSYDDVASVAKEHH
ncbi:DNA polymerase I, partial [Klebsiella pneumoniae]|nr:DNA polymerase I [Klebsiella pneumoniae]